MSVQRRSNADQAVGRASGPSGATVLVVSSIHFGEPAGLVERKSEKSMTPFLGDRSVRGLVQHSTQVFIAFRGPTALILLRAFFLARTGSHPSRQLRRRRECTGLRSYLRDDLLRRIHAQARYFRQSDHGVLMRLHD